MKFFPRVGKFITQRLLRVNPRRSAPPQAQEAPEGEYRRLVEEMPALVCRFLPDGTLTFVNQYYCDYFNLPRGALIGRNFFTFIPKEEQETVRQRIASLNPQNPVATYIHKVFAPDGSLRWQRWTDRALYDAQGNLAAFQSFGLDVTESYIANLELQASQELLSQTLRAANAGAWEWNLQTDEAVWTAENFLLLGLEPGSLQPSYQVWFNAIAAEDRQRVASQVRNAIQHRANLDLDFRVHLPDGSTRWLRMIGKLRLDENDEPAAMYGIQMDITAQKRIEQEMRALNEQLEQRVQARTAELQAANRDLEAFASSVSHDLRSPLRGIAGYASLLASGYASSLPAEAMNLIANIQKYTRLMSELIEALLDFSRLGRKEITLQEVEVETQARAVLSRLLEQEPDRQVEVQIGKLPRALADPALLEQVWVNLCSNALKYTRTRPVAKIEIGARQSEDQVVYYVRDNGVGFDMKYADRLFGVFQRLHLSEQFEGTGIGLANVKRIIERHSGKVWAEAEVERGAIFYFSLPCAPAGGECPAMPNPPLPQG